uniref:histone deacetylase n=1 Tax=Ascaris lumbricoides TaxID=6252 RepID=A0A0M3ITR8_ASCLU
MAALIAKRKIPNGFALIRPPGHHAQRNAANGFCVFNNVAQAAEEAYNFGEDRILIVDFDVHHGQGVQQSFYEEKRILIVDFDVHHGQGVQQSFYEEKRILIVDFDVHHGQGVQQSFYEEKRVMYCSIHRYEDGKFWPHLAESNFDHIGVSSGVGYNINIPLNEVK